MSRISPFVLGVTGNIACGKTTVLDMLAERGATVLDGDVVYHGMIGPGGALVPAIRERFGDGVIAPHGGVDRRALGAIVFADATALVDLERLTHPAVVAEIQARIAAATTPVVVVDGVKLIESGLDRACDRVWLVTCDPALQEERLVRRNGLDQTEARRRIAAQPDDDAKRNRVDLVIANDGTLDDLRAVINGAWRTSALPGGADHAAPAAGVGSAYRTASLTQTPKRKEPHDGRTN